MKLPVTFTLIAALCMHSVECGPVGGSGTKTDSLPNQRQDKLSEGEKTSQQQTDAGILSKIPKVRQENTASIALTMTRTSSVTVVRDPLALPIDVVDPSSDWDKINHEVVVRETGFYFFHLNVGAIAGQPVNMNLRGQPKNIDVYRGSTIHSGTDTFGKSFIQPVSAGTILHLENEPNFQLFSDENRQTSFTMVDLTYFLNPYQQTIFCAARRTDWFSLGKVQFDELVADEGDGFDEVFSKSDFIVKVTGLYVFTISMGIKAGVDLRVQIISKDQGRLSEIYHPDTSHDGEDVLSKMIVADLIAGDAVYVQLFSGEVHSDAERQTSFSGFLYAPREGAAIAWSVWSEVSHDATAGLIDPMPWEGVLVNTNNVFNTSVNMVHIRQHGIYYVEVNVQAQANRAMNVLLVQGVSRTEIGLSRTSTAHTGISGPLTGGLLLELNDGDTLKVVISQGSYTYSDADRVTTFSGFLVHPYPEFDP